MRARAERTWRMTGVVALVAMALAAPVAVAQDHEVPSGETGTTPGYQDGSQPATGYQSPYNVTPQQLNVSPQQVHRVPQGPAPAVGPTPAQGLVAYTPIPTDRLPGPAAATAPAATATPAPIPTVTNLGAPAINWGTYSLGPDDVVHVAVRNQPEFTGTFVIDHDGRIQFGFIGDVEADGLTKEELARTVEERLKRYVRAPSVVVTIIGFNSKAIYILGQVANPGKYAMRGNTIKIRDAVIAAGLVVPNAKLKSVHIVKAHDTNPTYSVVDLHEVLFKGLVRSNIDLVNGDIVVVPTTTWGKINGFLSNLINGAPGTVAGLAAL